MGRINRIVGIAPKFLLTLGEVKFDYVKAGKNNDGVYESLGKKIK